MQTALTFMRANCDDVYVYQIINRLCDAGIELYPTGSRYFGGNRDDSDWDFFCEMSDNNLIDKLLKAGFCIENAGHYNDRNTVGYNDTNTALVFCCHAIGRPKIHIQVVGSAELKCRVQDNRNFRAIYRVLNKKERRALWNMAYTLING